MYIFQVAILIIIIILGRVRGESGNSSSLHSKENSSNVANSGISTSNGGPIGLGGLFPTGIPKLKPVGSRTSAVEKNNSNVNNTNFGQSTVPSIKRGPPPIPPPATQKPQLFVQVKISKKLYVNIDLKILCHILEGKLNARTKYCRL